MEVLIIFPVILQTIINLIMLSIGEQRGVPVYDLTTLYVEKFRLKKWR